MSMMGNKSIDVDEDIVTLLESSKSLDEIDDIIAEMHGDMWRGRAAEMLEEQYRSLPQTLVYQTKNPLTSPTSMVLCAY